MPGLAGAEFVIGGILKTETHSEPFEVSTPHWPITLDASIRGLENEIQHITQFVR